MLKYKKSRLQKVIFYGFVGIIGTIVHFFTLVILVELFGVNPILSSIIGFILTVILSFVLNRKYTFKANSKNQKYLLIKYVIVSINGLMLNSLIMYFTVDILSIHYSFGQMIVVICIPIINFLLNNFWTFKEQTSNLGLNDKR
ncbi:GtrA family protein [Neobacillus sp. WH10]|uniref:GtrA family protein n=1 Tax=Neobacillus sp. WH10 TaxID=3047873 RepID=UPI0024C1776D|nr:GtrA family protein [Neobacillus sp. WH10]WHY76790.1 GtrA family protein [Neobacillus sp. WH10]